MITINSISKRYKKGNVLAVRNVSFEIYDNEIFALLGPNGAGKTTTLRMLSTLLTPTSGTIQYDGLPTVGNEIAIKKKLGFLTNEIRLDGQFSPNQSADFYGRLYGMTIEEIQRNKKHLFDYFHINEYADRKYETFSTGMKQKTSIAICLIHDPEIIIFDEPTNGLDVITQRLIEDYIFILKQKGKTIILSTHLLDVVERLADRVGVIIDGKSVFCGNCKEMMDSENVKNMNDAFLSMYTRNHEELPSANPRNFFKKVYN